MTYKHNKKGQSVRVTTKGQLSTKTYFKSYVKSQKLYVRAGSKQELSKYEAGLINEGQAEKRHTSIQINKQCSSRRRVKCQNEFPLFSFTTYCSLKLLYSVSLHQSDWKLWYTHQQNTYVIMGILGIDYTLRSGHVIFLLLVVSSVLLGFSYLNEMYQRIQLQEKVERQTQRIVSERSIIQHKASLLQTQIDNRNKEMKRLHDMHTFQTEQQKSICDKERNDLLQIISSKDDTLTKVQSEYENLKQRFELLLSKMAQFEKNQSRLLEKFSTQSTQCMNVIHMLSELCNKGKGSLMQRIAQVTKEEIPVNTKVPPSSTSVKATVSTPIVSASQDFNKTNGTHSTEFSTSSPPTKSTTIGSDRGKQKSLNVMHTLEELMSELNSTKSTEDIEDEIIKLEKIKNSTEKNSVFKSQTEKGGNDDEPFDEKDLPDNMPKKVKSQTQTTKKLTETNDKLPNLSEDLKTETQNTTKMKKINNPQYLNISKNENLDSALRKQTSLKVMQKLQELVSILNSTKSTEDKKDEINRLNKIKNSTEESNVFKSQNEKGGKDDEPSDERDLPKNTPLKEQTTKQQMGKKEKDPDLSEDSETETQNQTKIKKVNNPQYSKIANKDSVVLRKEELIDTPKENITIAAESAKSEVKASNTGNILEAQSKPQKLTLEKVEISDGDIYNAKGESEYDKTEYSENDMEMDEQAILEILS
ncbi:interaptin-like [Dendropsophus ebraccatus]|uniref:interaptin-like n=1 Tax=Dendropsophus ebraccatus TaxID=150705 RepID=UPI0038312345